MESTAFMKGDIADENPTITLKGKFVRNVSPGQVKRGLKKNYGNNFGIDLGTLTTRSLGSSPCASHSSSLRSLSASLA